MWRCSNTCNKIVQQFAQHCCIASCRANVYHRKLSYFWRIVPQVLLLVCPNTESQLTCLTINMFSTHVNRNIMMLVFLVIVEILQHLWHLKIKVNWQEMEYLVLWVWLLIAWPLIGGDLKFQRKKIEVFVLRFLKKIWFWCTSILLFLVPRRSVKNVKHKAWHKRVNVTQCHSCHRKTFVYLYISKQRSRWPPFIFFLF